MINGTHSDGILFQDLAALIKEEMQGRDINFQMILLVDLNLFNVTHRKSLDQEVVRLKEIP